MVFLGGSSLGQTFAAANPRSVLAAVVLRVLRIRKLEKRGCEFWTQAEGVPRQGWGRAEGADVDVAYCLL